MINSCKVHVSVLCIVDSVCSCLYYLLSSSLWSCVFQMWSICAPFSQRAQTMLFSRIWGSWTVRLCLCQQYLRDRWCSLEYVSGSEVSCNLIRFCESLLTVIHVFRFLFWKYPDRWLWFSCWRPVCSAWLTTPGKWIGYLKYSIVNDIHSLVSWMQLCIKKWLNDSVLV